MTQFANKSFSVAQSGRAPEECSHGWIRPNGECQFCGANEFIRWMQTGFLANIRGDRPTPPEA